MIYAENYSMDTVVGNVKVYVTQQQLSLLIAHSAISLRAN